MKKLIGGAAVCAVAVGLVAVPGTLAKQPKNTKHVGGTVSVNVTPNPVPDNVATVTASGNVASKSTCRKNRNVTFSWVDNSTTPPTVTAATGSATTGPNGAYTATNVSRPPLVSTTVPAPNYVLRATVAGPVTRTVGGKHHKPKRGRPFVCDSITGDSAQVGLVAPTP